MARARAAWAELLADLAVVVRAFGALLRAETTDAATAEEAPLADALDRLRLDRLRYAEVVLADPREHPDLWELNGALVALVDRTLLELDADAHTRLWEDRQDRTRDAGRPAAQAPRVPAAARRAPPSSRNESAGRTRARRTPPIGRLRMDETAPPRRRTPTHPSAPSPTLDSPWPPSFAVAV